MELKSRFRSFITPKLVFIVSLIIFSFFIISLYNGMLNPFFSATTNVYGQGADFFSFYQAGYNVLHDKLYYNFTKEDMVVPYLYSYRYSAFFAYTFGVIFNLAPPFISYRGWVVFIIIFLLFTSFYTLKITKKLGCGDSTRYISASMWLVFTPIYADLYLGQVSLFVSLLVFWSLYLETKKNKKSETLGNLLYAIASIIKYIPYLMILAYLKHKRTAKVIFSLVFTLFFIALWDLPHIMNMLKFNFILSTGGVGSEGSFDFRNLIYRFLHFMATNIFNLDGEEFITQFNSNLIYINALFIVGDGIITLYGIIYSQNYLVSLSLSVMAYFIMFSKIWEHHFIFILPFLILLFINENIPSQHGLKINKDKQHTRLINNSISGPNSTPNNASNIPSNSSSNPNSKMSQNSKYLLIIYVWLALPSLYYILRDFLFIDIIAFLYLLEKLLPILLLYIYLMKKALFWRKVITSPKNHHRLNIFAALNSILKNRNFKNEIILYKDNYVEKLPDFTAS